MANPGVEAEGVSRQNPDCVGVIKSFEGIFADEILSLDGYVDSAREIVTSEGKTRVEKEEELAQLDTYFERIKGVLYSAVQLLDSNSQAINNLDDAKKKEIFSLLESMVRKLELKDLDNMGWFAQVKDCQAGAQVFDILKGIREAKGKLYQLIEQLK
jgi:hypothetical protein